VALLSSPAATAAVSPAAAEIAAMAAPMTILPWRVSWPYISRSSTTPSCAEDPEEVLNDPGTAPALGVGPGLAGRWPAANHHCLRSNL
jgi:hypothetical protein